ncbi:hypothetical protein N657DRAFT_693854 [Parathielavia appendiculata]|uniref:Uncharacterized protein n=1 Tax=Parathielavia appendiculata TaxID=2587402 RepID=A0AAN6TRS0_9PEZI|nr:hypothetical protein N657DRAFT_693854 [Parathielavia appendiculata]
MLNLLQQHLGVRCLRIDGNVSYAGRLHILEEFRTTDVLILLITPRLALLAANYVHIAEAQWYPSVEEQAIAPNTGRYDHPITWSRT